MLVPQKVQLDAKVNLVACGGSHSAFVTEDQKIWMCGRGRDGQTGSIQLRSSSADRPSPAAIDPLGESAGVIEKIALGSNHSLAQVNL